jgi:hypothetical protein
MWENVLVTSVTVYKLFFKYEKNSPTFKGVVLTVTEQTT